MVHNARKKVKCATCSSGYRGSMKAKEELTIFKRTEEIRGVSEMFGG
jgi:hypothetical protein